MKILFFTIFILLYFFSYSQNVKVYKIENLNERVLRNSDTLYIVNFWATWCSPCVKELPYFEKLALEYVNKKIKILLVSLDFKKDLPRLKKFIQTKELKSEVWLLDETNYNKWLNKIDTNWSGSIPATWLIENKKGVRAFYEKNFTFEELKLLITPKINN